MGRSSGRLRASAGMLNNTQWTHVPPGASGSSMMSAKDWVPAGGSFHASAGEMSLPVQAYLAGMDCPFVNASLVSSRDMLASVAGISDDLADSVAVGTSKVAVSSEIEIVAGTGVRGGVQAATRRDANTR